jgi:hypothetical protein
LAPSRDPSSGTHVGWFRRAMLCLVAGALGCIADPGCDSAPQSVKPCAANGGTCVEDPVNHCVTTSPCGSSTDCLAGLGCFPVRAADTRTAPPPVGKLPGPYAASPQNSVCRLPTSDDMPLDTLVNGFGAALLNVSQVEMGSPGTYSFDAPSGVNVVSCAIFVCSPEVGPGPDNAVEITNFDECVVASTTSLHASAGFDVGSPVLPYTKPKLDPSAACPAAEDKTKPWVVSVLELGCWGYGETSVTAASLLVPLSPSLVNIPDLVVAQCADKDGYSCVLDDGSFGTCSAGACRVRCIRPQDCLPPLSTRPALEAGSEDADPGDDAGDGGGDAASSDAEALVDAGNAQAQPVCHATASGLGVCISPTTGADE